MRCRRPAIALLLAACSCGALAQAPLPQSTIELLGAANIPDDAIGAIAIRLDDGAVMLSHGAERSLQPASTMKVLTAIVALERLGPAWRARTDLVAAAPIANGRLDGDLILRGGGSPDFDWRALQRMVQQLRFKGIRRITGDLVLDRSLFRPPRPDVGVPPFDETPEFRYNVIPDALLLNTNLVQIDLGAGTTTLRARMTPSLRRVDIDTRGMKIVERSCDLWEDGWKLPSVVRSRDGRIRIVLHGEFPAGCNATTSINVLDRVDFADRLFRSLWRSEGGRFDGKVRDGIAPAGAALLAEHKSRPLAELVRDLNKRSDNPIARQLYLSLGTPAQAGVAAPIAVDTAERSERIVREWLLAHGLSGDGLVLENGSGLSRRERITPALLAGVVRAAAHSDWAPEFIATLPIAGVDGGMARRLAGSPAAIKGRFKTGTLRNAVSIAGIVPDATGRLCVVAVIINQEPPGDGWAKSARPVLDSVVDWVARSDVK